MAGIFVNNMKIKTKQRLELSGWILFIFLIVLGIPFLKWKEHRNEKVIQPRKNYCIYECMAARNVESNCNNWCGRD